MKMVRTCFFVILWIVLLPVNAMEWQALPDKAPAPADNPTTAGKVELGQMLYMDPRFSSTGTVSCNSCHNVMLGGEDNRAVSMGVHGQTGGRSAPTVWNSAFNSAQFWDGRAASLEDQAKGPVVNPIEMGMGELEEAMNRVRDIPGYRPYFHNGSVKTLDEAVRVMASVQLNKELDSTQTGDIVAFLYALTGEFPKQVLPRLPSTPGRSIVDR